MPFAITSRSAGLKRKIPFIDTEELVTEPEDVYEGIEADPPLHPARKRRIGEWAQAYLRGEPIFIASASLRGPFDEDSETSRSCSRPYRAGSIASSVVEENEQPPQNEETSTVNNYNSKVRKNTTDNTKCFNVAHTSEGLQNEEGVVASIEGESFNLHKPVVIVQGRPIYSHRVINNNGEENDLERPVVTWPHDLRTDNQIERWQATGRPYVQNTPWHRQKAIPPFRPRNSSATTQARSYCLDQEVSVQAVEVLDTTRENPLRPRSRNADVEKPSTSVPHTTVHDHNGQPVTPERQLLTIDTQCAVVAEVTDVDRYMESCQTADLLHDSQIHQGHIHKRLQDALRSNVIPVSPPIKLKQLEGAIDRQLSHRHDHPQQLDNTVLVTSSFGEQSGECAALLSKEVNVLEDPMSSASTDRILSSQPEEGAVSFAKIIPRQEPVSDIKSKSGRQSKSTSFAQTSLKKAFQVNKSFDEASKSPAKRSVQTESQNVVVAQTLDSYAKSQTHGPAAARSPSISRRSPRKGILTYGKRKSQTSLYSRSRNASFLETVPKSQRDLQRAVVETYGYNYDVGDDFDLDGTMTELSSFLTSWDREKVGTKM